MLNLCTHDMSRPAFLLALVASLAFAGCETVSRAREAQRDVHDQATGETTVEAEAPRVGESLEEMVAYAMANRPAMKSAWLAVEDARLALKEIEANAPLASSTPWNAFDANLSGGYAASSTPAHLDKMKVKTKGGWSAALSLDILIYDFGRNAANAKAQTERVIAAELSCLNTGYSIFESVAEAYFVRLQSAALLEVAFTNKQMRAEHLELAEARLKEGEAQRLDVTRARLDLAEANETVVAASNDLVMASANLASAIGLDAAGWSSEIPLSGEKFTRVFADTRERADELFYFARTNAPAMQASRAKLRAASAAVDYAIADLRPTVSASISLNWTDPLWYWRWGVNAAQSLFTGFRKTAAVDRARVALETSAKEVEEAELSLSLSIERAVAERDNARQALAAAQTSVRSAVDNLKTVYGQLAVGDASRIEYTDAVASYVTAMANSEKAFYRAQIAEAKLFALVGREPQYKNDNGGVE